MTLEQKCTEWLSANSMPTIDNTRINSLTAFAEQVRNDAIEECLDEHTKIAVAYTQNGKMEASYKVIRALKSPMTEVNL